MSKKSPENHFDTQVIGCGPAGLGLVVAADRLGRLDEWLRHGVLFVDKANPEHLGSGNLQGLNIRSNSPASDYLETIGKNGVFAEVLHTPIGLEIKRHRDQILSLLLVAKFLEALRERFERVLQDYPQSRLVSGTTITHADFLENGTQSSFETFARDGRSFGSKNLVLATGGRCKEFFPELRLEGLPPPTILDADSILHGQHTQEIIRSLEESTHDFIAIVGSSHSAWSAAHVLCETVLPESPFARIAILKPHGHVKVFYESRDAAKADGYHFDEGDVCPKTGRVNRFGGIRGDAKDLYRSVIANKGKHPVVFVNDDQEILEILGTAPVIISGIGYEANAVKIYDSRRAEAGLAAAAIEPPAIGECGLIEDYRIDPDSYCRIRDVRMNIDKNCRIIDLEGMVIENAYAIGLAHGVTPDETLGGEPNFNGTIDGVNLYQGVIGERLLQQIL